jgi:hypothetical protein
MTAARISERERPTALWSLGFRPFFLAAAVWAALAIALWIDLFLTGGALPSRFDPLTWHIHAMLFGFVPAAIAGFMLTAIPNWTGRPPIRGARLIGLVALWLLGRVACLISAVLPLWLAATVDLAFLVALCVVAAHEIIAARNWRNLMMPLPIGALAIANLLMYLELAQFNVPAGLGWRLAIAAIIALISAIGGRIIPAFHGQLVSETSSVSPSCRTWLDRQHRARDAPYRPSWLGVLSRLTTGRRRVAFRGGAQSLASGPLARNGDATRTIADDFACGICLAGDRRSATRWKPADRGDTGASRNTCSYSRSHWHHGAGGDDESSAGTHGPTIESRSHHDLDLRYGRTGRSRSGRSSVRGPTLLCAARYLGPTLGDQFSSYAWMYSPMLTQPRHDDDRPRA